MATESTPPSNAINSTLKPFFEEVTGIKVNIEVLPLEQVLQKLTLDVASGLGTYDTCYLDQSWMAARAMRKILVNFAPQTRPSNAGYALMIS